MSHEIANKLIRELLDNPFEFKESGRAYNLLGEYFGGFPLETLRPLLRSDALLVRHAAVFVVSELGRDAESLTNEFPALLKSGDRYIKYNILESISVCSTESQGSLYRFILEALEDEDLIIVTLAMRLISRSNKYQRESSVAALKRREDSLAVRAHEEGLSLFNKSESSKAKLLTALGSSNRLLRIYAVIAVSIAEDVEQSVFVAVDQIDDIEVNMFWQG